MCDELCKNGCKIDENAGETQTICCMLGNICCKLCRHCYKLDSNDGKLHNICCTLGKFADTQGSGNTPEVSELHTVRSYEVSKSAFYKNSKNSLKLVHFYLKLIQFGLKV